MSLRDYASAAGKAALGELAAECSQVAVDALAKLLDAEFKAGKAPDGTPWEPLKDGSGRSPLVRSGALQASISVVAAKGAIKLIVAAPYARYHQNKRPILPPKVLPPKWIAAVDRAMRKLLGERLPVPTS